MNAINVFSSFVLTRKLLKKNLIQGGATNLMMKVIYQTLTDQI